MNKKLFWILVLIGFAILMSLIVPFTRKIVEEEPVPVEVFVNNPTAKDELMKIRANQIKEEPIINITPINITDAGTENIQDLKEDRREVPENWTYYYHPNNSACVYSCNFDVCSINEYWCGVNESIYFENLTK